MSHISLVLAQSAISIQLFIQVCCAKRSILMFYLILLIGRYSSNSLFKSLVPNSVVSFFIWFGSQCDIHLTRHSSPLCQTQLSHVCIDSIPNIGQSVTVSSLLPVCVSLPVNHNYKSFYSSQATEHTGNGLLTHTISIIFFIVGFHNKDS